MQVNIAIDDDVFEKLADTAKQKDCHVNDVIRGILRCSTPENRKIKLGLITDDGSIKWREKEVEGEIYQYPISGAKLVGAIIRLDTKDGVGLNFIDKYVVQKEDNLIWTGRLVSSRFGNNAIEIILTLS